MLSLLAEQVCACLRFTLLSPSPSRYKEIRKETWCTAALGFCKEDKKKVECGAITRAGFQYSQIITPLIGLVTSYQIRDHSLKLFTPLLYPLQST